MSHLANAGAEARSAPASRLILGTSLVLVAFNLRPVFSSASTLLPEIRETLGLSGLGASILTTLPVICLGLFSPLAPRLSRWIGTERTLLGAVLLLACGTALRGLPSIPLLLLGTAVAGACIAVGNVLLPGLVKRDFPDRPALMTGWYTMALCAGAAGAAGLTLPLKHSLGLSLGGALAIWALPALLAGLLVALRPGSYAPQSKACGGAGLPGTSPCSWGCNRRWPIASSAGWCRSCASAGSTASLRAPSSRCR